MKNNSNNQKFTLLIRIKPTLKQDRNTYKVNQIEQILQSTSKTILINRKNNQEKLFKFNRVLTDETQHETYEECGHLIQSLFQGYNASFIAYGQTGTGKTHTIFGKNSNSPDDGYFYRAVQHLFDGIKKRMNSRQFAVRVSFLQFYMDGIYDLLENSPKKLQIKETLDDGIQIKDLTETSVKSIQELLLVFKQAIKYRKTQQTSINKRSSRSHAVIQINLIQRWNEDNDTKYLKGMIKIVDLAGSERVSKTQSYGTRLQEAKRINKQIATLGKCINLLAQSEKDNKMELTDKFNFNKSYIPYRDTKITRYLSEALGGKSKVVLCICISKYNVHLQETFSSLLFATQASTLKVESIRNQVYSFKKPSERNQQTYETPVKSKSQYKKSNTTVLDSLKVNNESSIKIETKKQNLLQKFKTQIEQIQEYLSNGKISMNISPAINAQNMIEYDKIFKILRKKYESNNKQSQYN